MPVSFKSLIQAATLFVAMTSPIFAQDRNTIPSFEHVLNVFDKSCVEVFVRNGGKGDLSAAFASVGLTQANALYRSDPNRPVMGYLNEDYFRGGMICAVEFPLLEDEDKYKLGEYLWALPADWREDKKLSTPFIGNCHIGSEGYERSTQTDDLPANFVDCDSEYHLKSAYQGTYYNIYMAWSDTQGPNYRSLILKFDNNPN